MKLEEGKKILMEGTLKSNAGVERIMENGQKLEQHYETISKRIDETKSILVNIDTQKAGLKKNISIYNKQLKKISEIINLRQQTMEIDEPNDLLGKKALTAAEKEEEEEFLEVLESLTRDSDKETVSENVNNIKKEDNSNDLNGQLEIIKLNINKNEKLLKDYSEKRCFYQKRLIKLYKLLVVIRKNALSNQMSVIESINDVSKVYLKCAMSSNFIKCKNKKIVLVKGIRLNEKILKKVKSK